MQINNYLKNLQAKHRELKKLIKMAYLTFQDNTHLSQLKKQKLFLKEKIANILEKPTSE